MTDTIPESMTWRDPAGVLPPQTPPPGDSNQESSFSNNNGEPPRRPEHKIQNNRNQDRNSHNCVDAVETGIYRHGDVLKDLFETQDVSLLRRL